MSSVVANDSQITTRETEANDSQIRVLNDAEIGCVSGGRADFSDVCSRVTTTAELVNPFDALPRCN